MNQSVEADVLYGLPAIAKYLRLTVNQTKHLARRRLPVYRIGRKVCASRSTLAAWLATQEAEAKAQTEPAN